MNGAGKRNFCGILLAFVGVQAALVWVAGAFRVSKHEADMVHLADLVLRMARGAVPHLDYMTPIGDLALRPIAALMTLPSRLAGVAELGLGNAMLWSQILVAAVLLPAVWWAGASRMGPRLAAVFGIATLGIVTGLVDGGTAPNLSMSMHYNRWAWGLTFVVVVITVVPANLRRADEVDGLVIGLCMGALAMMKVTYAAALALPVALGLLLQFRARVMWVGLLVVLAVWALVTRAYGIAFWQAYVDDLLAVMASDNRPYPSEPLGRVILSPAFTLATLTGAGAVLLLRRVSRGPGMALLLMLPAFVFIAYQNFGNDPLWLIPLAVCLLALLPEEGDRARAGIAAMALAALVIAGPAVLNMLFSPVRHVMQQDSAYVPFFPGQGHDDLKVAEGRATMAQTSQPLALPWQAAQAEEAAQTFGGRALPDCKLDGGILAVTKASVDELAAAGRLPERQPFVADLFAPHWLFADMAPLPGGAPWYYSGLPGFDNATHLLVPTCPASPDVRKRVLAALEVGGVPLNAVHESAYFTLYEIGGR